MTTAAVIGSGPNGLAAAVVLARAGLDVEVIEAEPDAGGGLRTLELTAPGYLHDVCSAVHPMALTSPFFRAFGLERRIEYRTPDISYAQAIAPGRSAIAWRDIGRTAAGLGGDGAAWQRLLGPLAERIDDLADLALRPLLRVPPAPMLAAAFGARVLTHGTRAGAAAFSGDDAPALLSGAIAHGSTRLPSLGAAAAGLALAAHGHAGGWPIPVGGARAVSDALLADLAAHGGRVRTGERIGSLDELDADVVVANTSARGLLRIGGGRLPARYRAALARQRYGDSVAKLDIALDGPVPWADGRLAGAGTVHLGGTAAEVARAEADVAAGRHPERPFVLLSQPSIVDDSRAPAGGATLWAYAHAPRRSTLDQTEAILARIERFAPGVRDRVVATAFSSAADVERHNANYVGGDIAAGAATFRQLVQRPVLSGSPWRTPVRGLYLASASAVPGPGIHGMAGYQAALAALADIGVAPPDLAPAG